jgi:hypothetical protein
MHDVRIVLQAAVLGTAFAVALSVASARGVGAVGEPPAILAPVLMATASGSGEHLCMALPTTLTTPDGLAAVGIQDGDLGGTIATDAINPADYDIPPARAGYGKAWYYDQYLDIIGEVLFAYDTDAAAHTAYQRLVEQLLTGQVVASGQPPPSQDFGSQGIGDEDDAALVYFSSQPLGAVPVVALTFRRGCVVALTMRFDAYSADHAAARTEVERLAHLIDQRLTAAGD